MEIKCPMCGSLDQRAILREHYTYKCRKCACCWKPGANNSAQPPADEIRDQYGAT